eukprot:COSAG02_NODE_989_length_15437_cov_95.731860_6_plen_71_part_00
MPSFDQFVARFGVLTFATFYGSMMVTGTSFVATAQGTGEKPQVTSVPSAIAGVYEFTAKPGVTYHIGALQ